MFYPASAGQTTPYPSNSLHIKSWWEEERDYRKEKRTRMRVGNVRKDEKGQVLKDLPRTW
ncbi:unnamed protein product [Penicillium camemberti]|uniref:Str. FM013 n=1 Tax=Penicillium camemberti (strain FM 013) TaxID=1429867 RepID=A0A0G4P3Q9_PENC3|nr:unnamed protein product [Penicillium camemberti]